MRLLQDSLTVLELSNISCDCCAALVEETPVQFQGINVVFLLQSSPVQVGSTRFGLAVQLHFQLLH